MFVLIEDFVSVIKEINSAPFIAVDTETNGLKPYGAATLFGISVSTPEKDYYFDYNTFFPEQLLIDRKQIPLILKDYSGVIFMHNAKFDMAFLAKEGLDLEDKKIHCTMAGARIENNNQLALTLKHLTKGFGHGKSDAVEQYIKEHKLWEWTQRPGKKKREKNKFYYKVPRDVVGPYAEQDTRSTLELGLYQIGSINKQISEVPASVPSIHNVLTTERRLTKVFYRMDRRGIPIDVDYTKKCLAFETANYKAAEQTYEALAGVPLRDSSKAHGNAFGHLQIPFGKTSKGNPSFTDKELEKLDHPLAKALQDYRGAYKRAGTYEGLLFHSEDGILHPNSKQAGTVTGRVSYSEPPMQCMEKAEESEEKYLVRRCFVPRPGFRLFMLDYDQMEYRMMLNYAAQLDLIEKVLGGLDVHTGTAEMMSTARHNAKTINFLLLYGGGSQILADALGITLDEAIALKQKYFDVLPKVKKFIRNVQSTIKARGYIYNFHGRRYYILDEDFAYKGPNYLIQGGCADWVKMAMITIDDYLQDKESNMLLAVHDEVVAEIAEGEEYVVPVIKHIMENVSAEAPHDKLPYTVGVDYSETSWQDKKEWKL